MFWLFPGAPSSPEHVASASVLSSSIFARFPHTAPVGTSTCPKFRVKLERTLGFGLVPCDRVSAREGGLGSGVGEAHGLCPLFESNFLSFLKQVLKHVSLYQGVFSV